MAALMLEFGVAGRIAPGERISGDLEVVHYYDGGGGALVAAIDGIGHGEQAAATARLAADTILRHPEEQPAALLTRCHAALRGTRGVVLSIASIDLPFIPLYLNPRSASAYTSLLAPPAATTPASKVGWWNVEQWKWQA